MIYENNIIIFHFQISLCINYIWFLTYQYYITLYLHHTSMPRENVSKDATYRKWMLLGGIDLIVYNEYLMTILVI